MLPRDQIWDMASLPSDYLEFPGFSEILEIIPKSSSPIPDLGLIVDPWCQYAFTRESLATDSPNHGVSWCSYFADIEGVDRDMHGAHMVATKANVINN